MEITWLIIEEIKINIHDFLQKYYQCICSTIWRMHAASSSICNYLILALFSFILPLIGFGRIVSVGFTHSVLFLKCRMKFCLSQAHSPLGPASDEVESFAEQGDVTRSMQLVPVHAIK